MRRLGLLLGYSAISGLMALSMAGCDSDPVSSSAPPPATVGPSTSTGNPHTHGPDTEDHSVEISDIKDLSFTVKDANLMNQVVAPVNGVPELVIHDGQVIDREKVQDTDSYCSFESEKTEFTAGDHFELSDLSISGSELTAMTQDLVTFSMTCWNTHSNQFRVSDLELILGGLATIQFDK